MNESTPTSTISTSSAVSKPTSPSPISIFGPPPLIDGEDEAAYNELLLQVSSAVGPSDFLEEILVRDVADLTWEILRWRRVKVHLISGRVLDLVKVRLAKSVKPKELDELVLLWKMQEPSAIDRVKKCLAAMGETLEEVAGDALIHLIGPIDRIEEFTSKAEGRRNAMLREIDRHRAAPAQRLRDQVQKIEDAEFNTIEHKAISQANTATKNAA